MSRDPKTGVIYGDPISDPVITTVSPTKEQVMKDEMPLVTMGDEYDVLETLAKDYLTVDSPQNRTYANKIRKAARIARHAVDNSQAVKDVKIRLDQLVRELDNEKGRAKLAEADVVLYKRFYHEECLARADANKKEVIAAGYVGDEIRRYKLRVLKMLAELPEHPQKRYFEYAGKDGIQIP